MKDGEVSNSAQTDAKEEENDDLDVEFFGKHMGEFYMHITQKLSAGGN